MRRMAAMWRAIENIQWWLLADLRRSGISWPDHHQSGAIGITEPEPVIFEVSPAREADNGIVNIVRHKGKITTWNSDRGFGFVTPAGGGERVFVHITAIVDRTR